MAPERIQLSADRLTLDWLLPALEQLDRLLEHAVSVAQVAYGANALTDPHRGLYINQDELERLLSCKSGNPLFHSEGRDNENLLLNTLSNNSRLAWLQKAFGLSSFELNLIVIALAPEFDLRYERFYAYLQDDVTRKRPTIDLALNLLCSEVAAKLERRTHFLPSAPLIDQGILHLIPDPHQVQSSFLSHYLKLDEQITSFLLGLPGLDSRLTICCELIEPVLPLDSLDLPTEIRQGLRALVLQAQETQQPLRLYFQGLPTLGQRTTAAALATEVGRPLLALNLIQALDAKIDFEQLLQILWREAMFQKGILYIESLDILRTQEAAIAYQQLLAALAKRKGITILAGVKPWGIDIGDSMDVIIVPFTMPNFAQRQACWQTCLKAEGIVLNANDLNALTDRFRLSSHQITNAVVMAKNQALWRTAQSTESRSILLTAKVQPTVLDLFAAARAQSGQALSILAPKIKPKFNWNDIVLPPDQLTQLKEICNQTKYRHLVYGEWGFEGKLSLGKGLNVLFSGPPGTGKTMAAEIIAHELQLDLHKIDLSQIVSKYIGETEKNLERIFTAAENANTILLFDEADSLFGKRSEVKDARDRYANLEISYLLQKMEEYEGIAILTSNLRQNLDEAFIRRIRFILEFPFPDEKYRLKIWQGIWPQEISLAADVDLKLLAQKFKLVGGSIRNIALVAAFLAAAENQRVDMKHLLHSTKREFQKMGRLIDEEEFSSIVKTDE